jgi:ribosomal protein L17
MTLLIPPVHAAVLAAVSIRHQRNTLNTHLNLLDDLSTQLLFRHEIETGFSRARQLSQGTERRSWLGSQFKQVSQ